MKANTSWLAIATTRKTVAAALKVALVVGTLLALINHGASLINGTLTLHSLIQILLTYLVPYCVSTYSTVAALRQS